MEKMINYLVNNTHYTREELQEYNEDQIVALADMYQMPLFARIRDKEESDTIDNVQLGDENID